MDRLDGKLLRTLRENSGLSLRKFAEKIYTTKTTLQRWESTSVVASEELLQNIADACGLTTEQLAEQIRNYVPSIDHEQPSIQPSITSEQTPTTAMTATAIDETPLDDKTRKELSFSAKLIAVSLCGLAVVALLSLILSLL